MRREISRYANFPEEQGNAPLYDVGNATKASGTANVAITPLGTNGHFDVHFQSAGNVVLQASVNDGVNAPVTALKSVTVNPANTAPQVSVTGVDNDATYEFGSVPNATCNVTDAEDGDRTFDATLSSISGPLSAHGLGSQTASCSYTDQGGLEANASKTYSIVDTTKPVIVYKNAATNPNGNGWYKDNVDANFEATDNVALAANTTGLDSTGKKANFSKTTTGEGVAVNVSSGTVTDVAGNVAVAVNSADYKVDKTALQVAYKTGSATPAANTAGWNNTNVTVTFEANDSLSGMGATDADKTTTDTATTSGEGTSVSVDSPAFTDRAGNTAAAGTATSPDFKIDKTKPTVTVTGVSNGATYTTGNVPTPGCKTEDQEGLSGVKTNASVNVIGGTGGFGNLTATCTGAADNADNNQDGPVSATYSVKAAFNGFLQPIDGHSVNTGKYGRTYPIKWQLRDNAGNLISDSAAQLLVGTMTGGQKAVSCTSFDLSDSDALEEATTGNTALRYDATSDQFIYNYKAPSSGSCYVFAIRNADGLTTQQIDFKFTK